MFVKYQQTYPLKLFKCVLCDRRIDCSVFYSSLPAAFSLPEQLTRVFAIVVEIWLLFFLSLCNWWCPCCQAMRTCVWVYMWKGGNGVCKLYFTLSHILCFVILSMKTCHIKKHKYIHLCVHVWVCFYVENVGHICVVEYYLISLRFRTDLRVHVIPFPNLLYNSIGFWNCKTKLSFLNTHPHTHRKVKVTLKHKSNNWYNYRASFKFWHINYSVVKMVRRRLHFG